MRDITFVPLGEIASLQAGVGFPLELQGRPSGDYPLAKVGDISRASRSGDTVIHSSDHFVNEEDLERLGAKPIPTGSILFAKIGEAIRQNHRIIAGRPLLIDNNAMAAVPSGRVESGYLYHFLRTVDFYSLASATTVPALRKTDLAKLKVPLPAIPEQRRIAAVLNRAEGLRASRRECVAQLEALTQSIFHDLLRQAGSHVNTVSIEDGMEEIIDYRGKSPTKTESGVPLVTARVVKNGRLLEPNEFIAEEDYAVWMRRGVPKAGDVLFTTEAPLGEVAQLDDRKVAVAQRLLVLRAKSSILDNTFLMHALTAQVVRDQINARATGSTVRGIRQRELRTVMLPVPPISLQHEFARRIVAVEKLRTIYSISLAEIDALFRSLQQRAFQGGL